MCNAVVSEDPYSLQYVPDWFEMLHEIWYEDDDYCNDDELIEWHNDYKKRKAQKEQVQEELGFIACHPSRWLDWGMTDWSTTKDEKRRIKTIFA